LTDDESLNKTFLNFFIDIIQSLQTNVWKKLTGKFVLKQNVRGIALLGAIVIADRFIFYFIVYNPICACFKV